MEEGRKNKCKVDLSMTCPVSGWPIDIIIQRQGKHGRRSNFYFFLQEEMCYNIEENREQPLALQKLMMRHVDAAQDKERGGVSAPQYISEMDLKMSFERQLESNNQDCGRSDLLDEDGQIDYSYANFDEIVNEIFD